MSLVLGLIVTGTAAGAGELKLVGELKRRAGLDKAADSVTGV
jgi:hypothetical protein